MSKTYMLDIKHEKDFFQHVGYDIVESYAQ